MAQKNKQAPFGTQLSLIHLLRPHFIFLYAPGARRTPQVWVPAADTLALSRALAHGATGLALKRSGQGTCIGLCAPFRCV